MIWTIVEACLQYSPHDFRRRDRVRKRERERERERERQTDRQTDRQTKRDIDRQTDVDALHTHANIFVIGMISVCISTVSAFLSKWRHIQIACLLFHSSCLAVLGLPNIGIGFITTWDKSI